MKRGHVALDGHHVVGLSADDGLRGVGLRVQGVDRDDRAGQVSERLQQLPDGWYLIALRVHGDLPQDRADAVGKGGDQVRAFPSLSFAPRTALPSIAITSRPPARTALVCSQAPRTRSSRSGLTRANARRNVDSSAGPRSAPSSASTSGPG